MTRASAAGDKGFAGLFSLEAGSCLEPIAHSDLGNERGFSLASTQPS